MIAIIAIVSANVSYLYQPSYENLRTVNPSAFLISKHCCVDVFLNACIFKQRKVLLFFKAVLSCEFVDQRNSISPHL